MNPSLYWLQSPRWCRIVSFRKNPEPSGEFYKLVPSRTVMCLVNKQTCYSVVDEQDVFDYQFVVPSMGLKIWIDENRIDTLTEL